MKKRKFVWMFIIILLLIIVSYEIFILLNRQHSSNAVEDVTELIQDKNQLNSVINDINIIDIDEELSVEDAIEHEYFVICVDNVYNKNVLERFVRNTEMNAKNRIPNKIRIVVYNYNNEPTIYDLEYKSLDEKYLNSDNAEKNKTGYSLIIDRSRVKSWETTLKNAEIQINDDIPGEIYGIKIVENDELNVAIITLSLYPEIITNSKYKDIEIARYILKH